MFKASPLLPLLLLNLTLNVQLYSSAPIPVTDFQFSVAEEPGPKELVPVEEEESVQEKLTLIVAGEEATLSPEDSPAEEEIAVAVKEPEPVLIEDQALVSAVEAISQEADPLQALAAVPQQSTEDETVPEEGAFEEASPDETETEVALAATTEGETPDQHDLEDPVQEAPAPVIPAKTSEDGEPEENAEEEMTFIEENAVENPSSEPQDVQDPDPVATVPVIAIGGSEDEASEEITEEEAVPEEMLLIDPDDHAAVGPDASQELLSSAPEEEEPVVLVPAEPETEEEGQEEIALQESSPGEHVILPEMTSEEPAPRDPILTIILEDPEEEAPDESTEEDEGEVVQSDHLTEEPALTTENSDPEILITSVTQTPSASETTETALDSVEEVLVAATETPAEAPLEPVTALAPTVDDAEAERTLIECGNSTSMTTDREAAVIQIEDEPGALVSRGAVLGAAFFALVCFIAIGFVWMTIAKKLR